MSNEEANAGAPTVYSEPVNVFSSYAEEQKHVIKSTQRKRVVMQIMTYALLLMITFIYAVSIGSKHWGVRLFIWIFSGLIAGFGVLAVILKRPIPLALFTLALALQILLDGIVSMIFLGYEQSKRPGIVIAILTVPEVITICCHFVAVIVALSLTLQAQTTSQKVIEQHFDRL